MPDKQCLSCADVNDFCAEECGVVAEHRSRHYTAWGWLGPGGVGGQGQDPNLLLLAPGVPQGTAARLALQALSLLGT